MTNVTGVWIIDVPDSDEVISKGKKLAILASLMKLSR